ncbi:MAG: lysophospholipid acyltransferase family protein [Microscillaceae bacterium]|nr:lysophospholipid acyltransferase family protein [Microscillaceae bacterium]
MARKKKEHEAPYANLFQYWIGKLWMKMMGWEVRGEVPKTGGKFVLVAAPHTSNWDFPHTLAAAYIFRLNIKWIGKHTLFKAPFGAMMRGLGGIPVNRKSSKGFVDQIVQKFNDTEHLVITISPSGTRDTVDYWKSGFYWIAYQSQVPFLLGYLDYANKIACLGLSFLPSGDISKDMDRIREFYQGIEGKHPQAAAQIRLREENLADL